MAEPGEIEMPEPHHVPSHERGFFNLIAVTVALLSAFLAVTKVKSDQTVQAMLTAKTDSVDAWNEYQAKRIRLHVDQAMLVQSKALRSLLNGDTATEYDKEVAKTGERAKRYEGELGELKSKAEAFEHKTEALHARHERFDLADAFLSISLAVLAVVALTQRRWLLLVAGAGALAGIALSVSAFAGWGLPVIAKLAGSH
ncbi:DUF4337 domain-containing protein [Roseiterribacter gracilis]|uniref:DUF4337 domain-containing protein n=1 Tax=Roseiterribacter gracilis TaxID=2812848 RepID=A0A8S8X707_9PROT|nr:hypothetical protein TMPK1_14450 [Rhodospirillales bacterium TMPK1]